jgi:hypothetical protein
MQRFNRRVCGRTRIEREDTPDLVVARDLMGRYRGPECLTLGWPLVSVTSCEASICEQFGPIDERVRCSMAAESGAYRDGSSVPFSMSR